MVLRHEAGRFESFVEDCGGETAYGDENENEGVLRLFDVEVLGEEGDEGAEVGEGDSDQKEGGHVEK